MGLIKGNVTGPTSALGYDFITFAKMHKIYFKIGMMSKYVNQK